jgi:hypothetical protein
MKQIFSWELNSPSIIQYFPCLHWKLNVHCCVHKSPSLVAALNKVNLLRYVYLRFVSILLFYMLLGFPKWLLVSDCDQILYALLTSYIHATQLAHLLYKHLFLLND